MSLVKVLVAMAVSQIATSQAVASLNVTINDVNGSPHVTTVPVADFPTPAADGTFSIEADFNDIPSGSFSGTVTALDSTGAAVGDAKSFSGTATNMQPIPVTVSVAYA